MKFGRYERTVDQKGRVTLPFHLLSTSHDNAVDWSRVIVIKGEGSFLYIYDLPTWRSILDQAYQSMDDDESRLFMHRVAADAQHSEVDNMKRITLSDALRDYAQIEKRASIVGMYNRLEIWKPENLDEHLDALDDVEIPTISDLARARIREVS